MSINGQLSHELEVEVSPNKAWELYGSLKLARLVEEEFKDLIDKIDVIEGDGGVGTRLKLTFAPGTPGLTYYVEQFVRIDNEKRVKDTDTVEGGYLEMGFTLHRIRFEIIEKADCSSSCIIKSTIFYEVNEEFAANASFVNTDSVAKIAEIAKNYLLKIQN